MTPPADASTCYICNDKRRSADTDADITPTGSQADSETLKQTLLRTLSHGHVEDIGSDLEKESGLSSGVCIVSLNSVCDGGLEAVSDRVVDDHVVICRRCAGLLKDFENHERTAARIAEQIRRFLMRQMEAEKEEVSGAVSTSVYRPQTSMKKIAARSHTERQGIMAAFRALRKSGVTEAKRQGRKRKKGPPSPEVIKKEEEDEDDDKSLDISLKEETDGEEIHQEITARQSQRIQRRREDGLVIRWGDDSYQNEDDAESNNDDDLFDYPSNVLLKDRSYVRRGRGRKITRVVRSALPGRAEYEMGHRLQCPFCFRYYVPMRSRIHNCTSYKNQLRCPTCNIFFTSYIRLERHLEVIHLKQKRLSCSMKDCDFMCITEPTLTIHKHFHVLESYPGNSKVAELGQQRKAQQKLVRNEEVIIVNDEDDTPKIADKISFLLDEKSFLHDGHPLHITTDRVPKNEQDEEDDCKVLRFQNNEKNQENPSSSSGRLEIGTLSSKKGEFEVYRGRNISLECPICDLTLVSNKSYQEHIQEVHQLRVLTKTINEDGSARESQEGPSSESVRRIVKKYYRVKKNSNAASKVTD